MKQKSITYSQSGVNYEQLDPAKKLALNAARSTAIHLKNFGFEEIQDSRGEAAFVWSQGKVLMAAVTESLGTKNLVADEMGKIEDPERSRRTYYNIIGYDSVASIVNDLSSVGAKPLVVHAFWAVGNSDWFNDIRRIKDLVNGWRKACDDAKATWGGGETPSYNNIVIKEVIALGGSSVGIIKSKKRLITETKLREKDRIILIKSSGINANGISLTRVLAKKLPKGYRENLPNGTLFGDAILTKTNIYAQLIQDLLDHRINIHYISNITGHGLRKIMRAKQNFTYVIEKIFDPQEIFLFIQKHANLNDYEMYQTYNMGQDYALFIPEKDVQKAQKIITKNKFQSINAGYVEKGKRQVIIKPKNIIYKSETLNLR